MIIDLEELYRIHHIINDVDEDGVLDYSSQGLNSFQDFVEWFSFKLGKNNVIYFNNDWIPYENEQWNDFNFIPFELLDESEEFIKEWVLKKIKSSEESYKEDLKDRLRRAENEVDILKKQISEDGII